MLNEEHSDCYRFLDYLDTGHYVYRNDEFVYVNQAAASMFGYRKADFLDNKLKVQDLFHHKDVPYIEQQIEDRRRHGVESVRYQARGVKKDGTFVDVEIHGTTGELDGERVLVGTVTDITQQKETQRQLVGSQKRYKSLFVHNDDAIYSMDLEGNFLEFNPAGERLTGYTAEEMLEGSFHFVVAPEDLDRTVQHFEKAKQGVTQKYEIRISHKSGDIRDIHVTNAPIIVDDSIVGVYGVAKDITKQKQAERRLRETHDELELIFQNTSDAIFMIGHDGRIMKANRQFEALLGRTADEINRYTHPPTIPEHFRKDKQELLRRLKAGESIPYHEVQRLHRDGTVIDVLASYQPVSHPEVLAIAIYKDITDQKVMRHQLAESEQRYKSLYDYNYDAVYSMDLNGHFIGANPACEKLSGYTSEEMQDMSFHSMIVVEDLQKTLQYFEKTKEGSAQSYTITIINKNRQKVCINVTNIPIYVDGEIVGIFGIAKDITDQRRQEKEIEYMAYYDQLTGLPNRTLFHDRLHQAWKHCQKEKESMAVLFLDLDGFKSVNDSLGHITGDHLLNEVSVRLHSCVDEDHTVARLGGDEFTILLPTVNETEEAALVADKVVKTLKKPFVLRGIEFHLTVSVGVALHNGESEIDVETIIKQADAAMYHVKEHGKDSYATFREDMDQQTLRKVVLENDFRQALVDKDFILEYQPIVEIGSGEIVSMESLVRWNHRTFGRISPDEFIPLAEEKGLIIPLGEWVLKAACQQCKSWHDKGFSDLKVSVNVSVVQLQNGPRFIDEVESILADTGLEPQYLDLEITETVLMQNEEFLIDILNEIRSMGIGISIDDFGTGYSSMSHLKNFSVNTLKIDRSFVCDMDSNQTSQAIVNSIIALASQLHLKTTAEGVEKGCQLQALHNENCKQMQGYYYSPPVSAEKMEQYLVCGRKLEFLEDQESPPHCLE